MRGLYQARPRLSRARVRDGRAFTHYTPASVPKASLRRAASVRRKIVHPDIEREADRHAVVILVIPRPPGTMPPIMPESLRPSTEWREQVAPDEALRFAEYGRQFAALQARKSSSFGPGRALHRKQIAAARGTLEVLADLPEFAGHGLFATPAALEVQVRLSNGSMDRAPDRKPDVRGLALRVLGVHGESALGHGPARSQDFLLINHSAFAFAKSDEFVDFVLAAAGGGGATVKYLIKRYGVLKGLQRLIRTIKSFGRPFAGFAATTVFSAAPIACGPYAVRVRLVPSADNGPGVKGPQDDWNLDFAGRLRRQALRWELQLQPFVNEALTPIEDASVEWPSPYSTVARLVLPQQDMSSTDGQALTQAVEASVFDPWQALAAHRPLGDVMRARKVVYFASQQGRGAA